MEHLITVAQQRQLMSEAMAFGFAVGIAFSISLTAGFMVISLLEHRWKLRKAKAAA